jgi:hypothetical protein
MNFLLNYNFEIHVDWGLGIGDWAQSPIPNTQSPIPNPQIYFYFLIQLIIYKFKNIKYIIIIK